MFDPDATACVGAVVGALGIGQGRRGFFAASGLAMGQTRGRQVIVPDQAQITQISQQGKQVKQAQVYIELVVRQFVRAGSTPRLRRVRYKALARWWACSQAL